MTESALKGKKVLIVEDDPLLHNLLADKMAQLRESGVEVYPMVNGEEGLVKSREVHPDLIFLEKLRAEEGLAKVPVVVLSNLSADTDKEKARALGVIAYLVKADFSLSEISDAVSEILSGKPLSNHESAAPDIKKTSKGYMVYL